MQQNGKYALVTGATSGIGYELSKLFAQDGYNLVIVARTESDLDSTANELKKHNVEVIQFSKDLFKREAAFELYNEVKAKGIEIDVLVNNAGQGEYGEFVDTDIDRELDIIQLNIGAVIILTKHFLKDMVARGSGKILNVTSIAGKTPGPYHSVYHGTKAFAHSFTEAIRSEVKDRGITVTSLLPGITDTDFFNKADMLDSKAVQEEKMADPADVAKDGFEALMSGKDMVVSGLKNKMQVDMGSVIPDSIIADKTKNQQQPVDHDKK